MMDSRKPFQDLNNTNEWNEALDIPSCDSEKPFSKAVASRLNKLLNPRLIDTFDLELEILRMDPNHPLHSVNTFKEMNLKPELMKGLCSMGFYKPSMIQERALPALLKENPINMIAQSQSGTGKTAAFMVSILSKVNTEKQFCQCLCMVPTRELARQLVDVGKAMAKYMQDVKFGLAVRDPIASTDDDGYVTDHIVIGTPGTIANWIRCFGAYRIKADYLTMFVLDEADVMMDVGGFLNICMRIKGKLSETCQVLLFSATFEDDVIGFAREFVPNAVEFRMKRSQLPLENIRQFHLSFNDWQEKYFALTDIYGGFSVGQAIIFCATRKESAWLEDRLSGDGHHVAVLSGELDVSDREKVIQQFRCADCRVLITTNVCARGLDIPQVNLIINWNMPQLRDGSADCDTYLHRIGRSGRFGKEGVAVNFITHDEFYIIQELETHFDIKIPLLTSDDLLEA